MMAHDHLQGRLSILGCLLVGMLGKITFGVRAVDTQCGLIGPAANRINADLGQAAAGSRRRRRSRGAWHAEPRGWVTDLSNERTPCSRAVPAHGDVKRTRQAR